MKDFLIPTKKRIIFTIIVSFSILLIILVGSEMMCPAILRLCPATSETPGATLYPDGYFINNAKGVPFSCTQVCSSGEYYSELVNVILIKIIIPIIIIYLIACLIFPYKKLKKVI